MYCALNAFCVRVVKALTELRVFYCSNPKVIYYFCYCRGDPR